MSLEPGTASLIEAMRAAGTPPLHTLTAVQAREAMRRESPPGPAMHRQYDITLTSVDESRFDVRVLQPTTSPKGALLYLHGGGWVLGSIEQSTSLAQEMAAATDHTVVLVGYRKSPEHIYPAALEDGWAALQWVADHMADMGVQRRRLVLMGDSAGGNLAALLAIRARDLGGPRVDAQVLVYPVTDCDLDRPSYQAPENQLILTRSTMSWFWDHYLPDEGKRHDPAVSPLRSPDLSGLPRTVVMTAEYDVLRDEGEAYADLLRSAGVHVTTRRFEGQTHGFFTMLGVLDGWRAGVDFLAQVLQEGDSIAS